MNKFASTYITEFNNSLQKDAFGVGDVGNFIWNSVKDPVVGMWDNGKGVVNSIGRGDLAGVASHGLGFLGDAVMTAGNASMLMPGVGLATGAGARLLGAGIRGASMLGKGSKILSTGAQVARNSAVTASQFGKANAAANSAAWKASKESSKAVFNKLDIDKMQKIVNPSAAQAGKLQLAQQDLVMQQARAAGTAAQSQTHRGIASATDSAYNAAMSSGELGMGMKAALGAQRGLGKLHNAIGKASVGLNNWSTNTGIGRLVGNASGQGFKASFKPTLFGAGLGVVGAGARTFSDAGQYESMLADPEFRRFHGENRATNLDKLESDDDKLRSYDTLRESGTFDRFNQWKARQQA